MTIRVGPLSKLFNHLSPSRIEALNRDLLALAGATQRPPDEVQFWKQIEKLLQAGAQINAQDKAGNTALNLLCDKQYVYAATKLIEHGADMTIANDAGQTPFLAAAYAGDAGLLKAFIAHNVDLNQVTPRNENAVTMLVYAVPLGSDPSRMRMEQRAEALKVLVDAGIKVDKGASMRIYHHSPEFVAVVPELAKIHALSAAMNNGDPAKAIEVITGGVHPDAVTEFGDQSALAFGASVGDTALIDAALKAGAKINLTSGDSRATALQVAALKGQREAFVHLLDAGANPNQICSRFEPPQLYNAARECPDPDMVKFVTDTLHDRDKDALILKADIQVKPIRLNK